MAYGNEGIWSLLANTGAAGGAMGLGGLLGMGGLSMLPMLLSLGDNPEEAYRKRVANAEAQFLSPEAIDRSHQSIFRNLMGGPGFAAMQNALTAGAAGAGNATQRYLGRTEGDGKTGHGAAMSAAAGSMLGLHQSQGIASMWQQALEMANRNAQMRFQAATQFQPRPSMVGPMAAAGINAFMPQAFQYLNRPKWGGFPSNAWTAATNYNSGWGRGY